MAKHVRTFWVLVPGATEWTQHTNIEAYAKEHDLVSREIHKAIRLNTHTKGYRFRRADPQTNPLNYAAALVKQDGDAPTNLDAAYVENLSRKERTELVRRWASATVSKITENLAKWTVAPETKPVRADPGKDLDTIRKIVESEGLEWKHVQDARRPEEKFLDAVATLLDTPEELFTQTDDVLDAIEEGARLGIQEAEKYITVRAKREPLDPASTPVRVMEFPPWMGGRDPKAVASVMGRWLARVQRVKSLRAMVRDPIPSHLDDGTRLRRIALEATWVLRYQLYVGRSDITGGSEAQSVFDVGRHHVKMAVDIHMMIRRACFEPRFFVLFAGEEVVTEHGAKRTFTGSGQSGALVSYPPRHGKTAYLRHLVAFLIGQNPRVQGGYLHARQDEAHAFNKYVQSLFSPDNRAGRRNLSLFPNRLADRDCGAGSTRVHTDDPPKNPNLIADSVWGAAQGNNLDFLIGDDMVPQDDSEMHDQRNRRKSRFSGTWLTRLQGPGAWWIASGYPWHHDDLLWTLLRDAKENARTKGRSGRNVKVSMLAVGGPQSDPPFKPIWAKYGQKALRQIYLRLGDASVWAANYMLNPLTDELRIVRKIRLFDPSPPHDPGQHQRFLLGAENHLSLDPAFTGGETSDRAGLVRASIGLLEDHRREGEITKITSKMKIRVTEALEITTTQKELSDTAAAICRTTRIDRVHYEGGNAGTAFEEFLSTLHGIESVEEHKPGHRSKERRLRQVSYLLEDDAADLEAVVEFPGVPTQIGVTPTGEPIFELRLDPRFKRLRDYIVDFRVTSGHHCLDALTQLLSSLASQVGGAGGDATVEARRHQAAATPNRKAELMRQDRELRASMEREGLLLYANGGMHV